MIMTIINTTTLFCDDSIMAFTELLTPGNILLLLGFCAFLAYIIDRKQRSSLSVLKINGPLALPIVGNCYLFFEGPQVALDKISSLMNRYKPFLKLWFGNKSVTIPSEPEDINFILNNFVEKGPIYKYAVPIFGDGLITCPEEKWKLHRKDIAPKFKTTTLNRHIDSITKFSDTLINQLQMTAIGNYVDVLPYLLHCTLGIICDIIFGENARIDHNEVAKLFNRNSEIAGKRFWGGYLAIDYFWKRSPLSAESDENSRNINVSLEKVIKERKDNTQSCLLDHLLELKSEDEKWSLTDVIDEIRTIMVAGSDAPALTVGHVLIILGLYPEIQNRVYQEVSSVCSGCLSNDTLSQLDYLERVILETMRVLPVGSIVARYIKKDTLLNNFTIAKNSNIIISIYHLHRNPLFWPDPLKFDPDRFLPEEVKKRRRGVYIPFGSGPRDCIGRHFGMAIVKALVAAVVQKLEVVGTTYKTLEDVKLKPHLSSKCIDGYCLKFEKRK